MKIKEIKTQRDKSLNELNKLVNKKRLKLVEEIANLKTSGKKSPKKVRTLKRDIAQILTIIREKELVAQEKGKVEKKERSKKSD